MNKMFSCAFVAALCCAPLAHAATYTVTNLADSGAGSLRSALSAANANAGADIVQFQAGLEGTISLTTGELPVTDSVSINGPGAHRLTIDANNISRVFRLSNANGQDKVFAISGLTITRAKIAGASEDSGGGLFYEANSLNAEITISGVSFTNNQAGRKGGAVSVSGANLTIRDTDMTNNRAQDGYQPSGGALFFQRGLLTIERSAFIGNSASLNGGAIQLASPAVNAVITDSLIKNNTAEHSGGGMIAGTMHNLKISRSAFVGNSTGEPFGGAIYFAGATDAGAPENVIENTIFSANVSRHQLGRGSGLTVWSGNMTVRNSTFAYNQTGPDWEFDGNAGGALWVNDGASTYTTVESTLFANNTHSAAGARIDIGRAVTGNGTLNVRHSLFYSVPASNVINGVSEANLLETNPIVQALTLIPTRGFVPVHPIPANSPAVDAGSNPANLSTDQRGTGFARAIDANPCRYPQIARADIGAFEYRGDTIFCHHFDN